jgi:hypothetical protein
VRRTSPSRATPGDATATAFAHRAPGYSLLIVSQWPDPRETEPNITWAKETFEALHPYLANRSYVNNLTADDGRLVHHLWGANYERPVTAKRRYDPDNIFRLNHNIDPRPEAPGRDAASPRRCSKQAREAPTPPARPTAPSSAWSVQE